MKKLEIFTNGYKCVLDFVLKSFLSLDLQGSQEVTEHFGGPNAYTASSN